MAPALVLGGDLKSFRIPTAHSQPRHITLGSDGNMWFTESDMNVSQIGRVDPRGNITEFIPTVCLDVTSFVANSCGPPRG